MNMVEKLKLLEILCKKGEKNHRIMTFYVYTVIMVGLDVLQRKYLDQHRRVQQQVLCRSDAR